MLDPEQLIEVANLLIEQARDAQGPDVFMFEAHFRRAVSTAYYALFHKIAGVAAAEFANAGQMDLAVYSLIYRGFDHRQMKKVFQAIQVAELSQRTRTELSRQHVSQALRDVGSAFVKLQDARHAADYDPKLFITRFDAAALVGTAMEAISAFDTVDRDERRDVLALILVGARG